MLQKTQQPQAWRNFSGTEWQREIKQMLSNGFKLEVEALISKDISYVTETYVPERLKANDWLGDRD